MQALAGLEITVFWLDATGGICRFRVSGKTYVESVAAA
ncbi:hypothetical protein WCP94_001944 [Bilophila wadsworthia]